MHDMTSYHTNTHRGTVMPIHIANQHTFSPELVEAAQLIEDGSFVVVDDDAFAANGLGRKVAQTMQVDDGSRVFSVAYVGDDSTYEVVLARDEPRILGTLEEIIRSNEIRYRDLDKAFGGLGHWTPVEMATAIERGGREPTLSATDLAVFARSHARRAAWVVANRLDAVSSSPVNWAKLGI